MAAPVQIAIDPHPAHDVPRTLHGLFFEDINYGADGGLYAELVQNRSFEHREALHAWSAVQASGSGTFAVSGENPFHPKNPHFLRLNTAGAEFGVANEGWDGMPLDPGARYHFSTLARHFDGQGGLLVRLKSREGQTLAEARIDDLGAAWKRHEVTLTSSGKSDHARLEVLATAPGTTDLDMVSLFPANTWNQRKNGLRADLVKVLKEMRPGFLRFPGGCIVEGQNMANAYRWKETIGDTATRPQNKNRWMDSFKIKAPQYYQSYGLGFFEFFLLCKDLGAEPLPILNCGMSCQFDKGGNVPVDQLNPYIQDALDLIEFANGPATSTWGAQRAAMGHPEPFHLKYLGVGNEQWGPEYIERYRPFHAAIKAKHPEIQLVMATGPRVDDDKWKFIMDQIKNGVPTDVLDEHYYCPPDWFVANADRYDRYDRKGPKIFAGEFAAHTKNKVSSLQAAIAEAALMTGILRNSDVVIMASYAPLLAKKDHTQWFPDLIYFDNRRICLTPSYHVQMLFGQHRPDAILPVTLSENLLPSEPGAPSRPDGKRLHATAGIDRSTGETVAFIVNANGQATDAVLSLQNGRFTGGNARRIVLTGSHPDEVNTLEKPDAIQPRTDAVPVQDGRVTVPCPPHSLTILRIP
jgi:alpha-L-arabinofuranosidase